MNKFENKGKLQGWGRIVKQLIYILEIFKKMSSNGFLSPYPLEAQGLAFNLRACEYSATHPSQETMPMLQSRHNLQRAGECQQPARCQATYRYW